MLLSFLFALGWIVFPQDPCPPETSECDLIWKWGLCRWNSLQWGHIRLDWVLLSRGTSRRKSLLLGVSPSLSHDFHDHIISNTTSVGFSFHTKRFSESPAGCPTIRVWHKLKIAHSPQIKSSGPWECPPLEMPITRSRSPGHPQLLSDLATNRRFVPTTPSLHSSIC